MKSNMRGFRARTAKRIKCQRMTPLQARTRPRRRATALSPVPLGRGEAMFEGLDLPALGYRVMKSIATDLATHVVLGRQENE